MKTLEHIRIGALLASLALLANSCGHSQPIAPDESPKMMVTRPTPAVEELSLGANTLGESEIEGTIGPGARYFISVPESWNGDLVLYAHGYTAPIFPVGIPPGEDVLVQGMRGIALQSGFAFAYSTFSQTGFGLKDAAQRTEQLLGVFTSRVSRPQRTFLIGASFGGLVALQLVETHPDRFAGVLTLCGMVGGARAEVDYASNVRVLFDYFYEGVLPGSLYELPPGLNLETDLILPVVGAIAANPEPALALSQITQTPIPFSNGEELVGSIVQALVFWAVGLEDLLDRTHGQGFFDNTETVYTGNLPPELLADVNARVARFSDGTAAANLLDKYYEPSGDLHDPVVSFHISLDPVVPVFHEALYRSKVEARGRSEFLQQTTVERYGHLLFTESELVTAFQMMVASAEAERVALP